MADIKFACPTCQQHIQAESGYAGVQIVCPACHASLIVPGTPAPPALVAVSAPAYAAGPAVPAAPSVTAAPRSAAGSACPSCKGPLPRGAVLCTRCGYNLATGQRTVAGRPAPLGKPGAPQWEVPWYKTAYPYIGALLVVLSVLYFFGKENEGMKMAFVGVAALYYIAVQILVLIAAFKESVATGFLTLCVPFYGVYFVWKVCENQTLQLLYTVAILLWFVLKFVL
jgi:hypothetical protein